MIVLDGITRSVSIEKWCELSRTGEVMPIRIQLNGKSMEPLIRMNRDYVTIVPLRREPQKSDIVMFLDVKGRYCAHRVKRVETDRILTIGDYCYIHDPWTDRNRVFGLIVSMERDGKKYNLDSPAFRFYGKIRMALLPLRKVVHSLILKLWSVYVKLFKKDRGGKSDA